MKDATPEKTLDKRITSFNEELKTLLGKYQLALTAEPRFAPTKEGFFVVIAEPKLADATPAPTVSPVK